MKSRLNIIKQFHDDSLKEYRNKSLSHHIVCGWGSIESQEERFSALMKTLKYNGGRIVDFGCGTGDLYKFILRKYGKVKYTGVDYNEKMLKIARQTYNAEFIQCGFDQINFNQTEFVVASGVFQFRDVSNPFYYVQLVEKLFSKCLVGLAVNFLSASREESEKIDCELYLEPSQVVQLAESISPMWAIDHSYHLGFGDVTMALFHADMDKQWTRPKY